MHYVPACVCVCVCVCACVRVCVCAWQNRRQNQARSKSNEPCPYLAHVSVESIRLAFPLIPIESEVTFRLPDRSNAQHNAINAHSRARQNMYISLRKAPTFFPPSFDRKFLSFFVIMFLLELDWNRLVHRNWFETRLFPKVILRLNLH